jgi:hypothetical protein
MGTRRKPSRKYKRKRNSLRKSGGNGSPPLSYDNVYSQNETINGNVETVNPMHETVYVVKYTKTSSGEIKNKEVFIQGINSYKHYMIDKDETGDEFEETTHTCLNSIPFDRIGEYLNSPFNTENCKLQNPINK